MGFLDCTVPQYCVLCSGFAIDHSITVWHGTTLSILSSVSSGCGLECVKMNFFQYRSVSGIRVRVQ
jgi:hypothetical protein